MSFVSILMKNDRVIKGFYCMSEILGIQMRATSQEMLTVSILGMYLKITNLIKTASPWNQ